MKNLQNNRYTLKNDTRYGHRLYDGSIPLEGEHVTRR